MSLPRGPMQVPASLRPRLLATFDSGFKLEDSHGGFAIGGITYAPMQPAMGTLVQYRDGGWTSSPGRAARGCPPRSASPARTFP